MERHSLVSPAERTSTSSAARPTRQTNQPQGSQTRSDGPAPLCLLDQHLMGLVPGWKPADETRINRLLAYLGADTPEKRETYLKGFNAASAEVIQRGFHVVGAKPKQDDQNVYNLRIPNSDLAIRMWEGGMGPYGQFCVDFYDVKRKVSVNLPPGHSLHPATVSAPASFAHYCFASPVRHTTMYPPPGFPMAMNAPGFQMAGQLRSWERNMGMREIPDGEEKWMVPQGAYIALKRDGHPDVVFQIPTLQPAFVALQPQLGPP